MSDFIIEEANQKVSKFISEEVEKRLEIHLKAIHGIETTELLKRSADVVLKLQAENAALKRVADAAAQAYPILKIHGMGDYLGKALAALDTESKLLTKRFSEESDT